MFLRDFSLRRVWTTSEYNLKKPKKKKTISLIFAKFKMSKMFARFCRVLWIEFLTENLIANFTNRCFVQTLSLKQFKRVQLSQNLNNSAAYKSACKPWFRFCRERARHKFSLSYLYVSCSIQFSSDFRHKKSAKFASKPLENRPSLWLRRMRRRRALRWRSRRRPRGRCRTGNNFTAHEGGDTGSLIGKFSATFS